HKIVVHGDTVYLSGFTAKDKTEDMRGQTKEIISSINDALNSVGSSLERVLSATIFISDVASKSDLNAVWLEEFPEAQLPACTVVGGVSLVTLNTLVEITCVAATSRHEEHDG